MLARRLRYTFYFALALALGGAGCSDDDAGSPVAPSTGSVTVNFDHEVDGMALQFGVFDYTNAANNNYSVDRLDYYVSDIRLHRANGTTYGVDDVHFRDASDDATRSYRVTGVPDGTYQAVSFVFGLDAHTNTTGGLPAGTPTVGMEWPECWGGGYHYMILEGKYKDAGPDNEYGYRVHTGRRRLIQGGPLNCDTSANGGPDLVSHHHFFEVMLPLPSFSVSGDNWQVSVIMNINGWYEDPVFNLDTFFPKGAGGIMIDLAAQGLLRENGPRCFSVTPALKP